MLLVGAAARDVLLVHFHGVAILRATEDTDVAVAVRDWDSFLALRQRLIDSRLFREDRRYETRKDASDLWALLLYYADAGNHDRLYGPECEAALASFGYDLDLAAAWLLGRDARQVLSHGGEPALALREISRILLPETDADGPLRLVSQMPPGDRDRQLACLVAFRDGFFEES
jgi:predicted nucleotidyltransferase